MALDVPHVKVHLVLKNKALVNEDNTVWTLYFRPPGGSIPSGPSGTVAVDNLQFAIQGFIDAIPTGHANSVGGFLGASVAHTGTAIDMKLYAIPIARVQVLGPPFATRTFGIAGIAPTLNYPSEVSSCLTYHADLNGVPERGPNGTRPASSRRGRIYIGPLSAGTGAEDANTGFAHASPTFRDVVTTSAHEQLAAAAGAASWNWVVFSKTLWEAHNVAGVWMNDAFDTQRRRGQDPTVKTARTF